MTIAPDQLAEFLAQHCVTEPGASAVASELYIAYSWHGGKLSATAFGRAMAGRFPKSKATSGENRNKFIYQGVRLHATGASDPAQPHVSPQIPTETQSQTVEGLEHIPATCDELTYENIDHLTAIEVIGSNNALKKASTASGQHAPNGPDSNQCANESDTSLIPATDSKQASQPVNTGEADNLQANRTPQPAQATADNEAGDVPLTLAESAAVYAVELPKTLPNARARDGETRKQCWERLRQEARTAGMTRRDAISYAGTAVAQVWVPPPEPEPVAEKIPEPEELPAAVDIQEPEEEPVPDAPVTADQGVSGLSNIPEAWPPLPDNASLQAEISWVSANRLRVRDGTGVDLSRASVPAPSYSALSWLETSILFPSKFADISVKATSQQDDEREQVRREKMAIEEIRGLLAEMLEDGDV